MKREGIDVNGSGGDLF